MHHEEGMSGNTLRHCIHLLVALPLAPAPTQADEVASIPALHAAAEVIRDTHGIAHIYAANEHDLFFLQGWVHAEDRLFQMDRRRREFSGTLAELVGSPALDGDIEMRALGLRRAAERALPLVSDDGRQALDAYAEGVNAWVERHSLPREYADLELSQLTPWTPIDSIVILKGIGFLLSFTLDIRTTELFQAYLGASQGIDGEALFFEDVMRAAPFEDAATLLDAQGGIPAGNAVGAGAAKTQSYGSFCLDDTVLALAGRYLERVAALPLFQEALAPGTRVSGSNAWVVSGVHTASGSPLLAGDPHSVLDTPSWLYPIHLVVEGEINATGVGFAGVPTIQIGNNNRVAWGITNNPIDVTDTFEEEIVQDETSASGLSTVYQGEREHVVALPQIFRWNRDRDGSMDNFTTAGAAHAPQEILIIPRRNQGPLVEFDTRTGVGLSIAYANLSGGRDFDGSYRLLHARDVEELGEATELFVFASLNFLCADVDGNIASFTSGKVPLREDLEAGAIEGAPPFTIRNGRGGNEWLPPAAEQAEHGFSYAFIPFSEMPQVINPPSGVILNANHDPVGDSLDNDAFNALRPTGGIYYLNWEYLGLRAGRARELLAQLVKRGAISRDDMRAMQADTVQFDAQVLVPYILTAFENGLREDADPMLAELAQDAAVAEAVERLAAWDFSTPTGIAEGYDAIDSEGTLSPPGATEVAHSIAATIYAVWRGRIVEKAVHAPLQRARLPTPTSQFAIKLLRHLLDGFGETGGTGASGIDFFKVGRVENPEASRDVLLLRSLSDSLKMLRLIAYGSVFRASANQDDYRWGRLHRVLFPHRLGGSYSTPPAFGTFPDPIAGFEGIPVDGGWNTLDQSPNFSMARRPDDFLFTFGPAARLSAEASPEGIVEELELPGGTSSDPESPFYQNLLRRWLTNDSIELLVARDAVVSAAVQTTRFAPDVVFRRGDCDGDGSACSGVGDALELLSWLFLGKAEPSCLAACDPDGSGNVELADAVYGLNFCFQGTQAPVAPFPECGTGSTADVGLGCTRSACQ